MKNILDDIKRRERPFDLPDGYFPALEESIREKIARPERVGNPILGAVRTGFALAVSFAFIFMMGYGVMSLTKTLSLPDFTAEDDMLSTLMECGYLEHDFIDYLYDEIDFEGAILVEEIEIYDGLSEKIESDLSESDLIKIIEEYE